MDADGNYPEGGSGNGLVVTGAGGGSVNIVPFPIPDEQTSSLPCRRGLQEYYGVLDDSCDSNCQCLGTVVLEFNLTRFGNCPLHTNPFPSIQDLINYWQGVQAQA